MRRWVPIFAAAALCAGPACAQVTTGLGLSPKDANAPIQVASDNFDADLNAKTGVYTGNVIITQGDMTLHADKVRINTVAGKPDKIYADGSVVFVAPNGNAKGDAGVYDVAPRLITMTGKVILNKEKNVMRGTTLVVNLVTGMAHLNAKGATGGGRVKALLIPPPSSQSGSQSNGTQNTPQDTPKPNP
jgi:lipopolysaccharide export system protein LptA